MKRMKRVGLLLKMNVCDYQHADYLAYSSATLPSDRALAQLICPADGPVKYACNQAQGYPQAYLIVQMYCDCHVTSDFKAKGASWRAYH